MYQLTNNCVIIIISFLMFLLPINFLIIIKHNNAKIVNYLFSLSKTDTTVIHKLRELGEQKSTETRICKELPGYNWLEEKIRKSSITSDPPTTQPHSSTSSSAAAAASNVEDGGGGLQPKLSARSTESSYNQE